MTSVIGWDIGGAHLKAARADGGRLIALAQLPCTPHLGLAHLERAIDDALARLGPAPRHRVTMTAELSDAFEDRARGVIAIAAIFAQRVLAPDIAFYAGVRGLVTRDAIAASADDIASANWRASAELVARRCAEALFIDMGSTTTDLTPIFAGRVAALGASDSERLVHGELAYAGFSRGAPQAYARRAPLEGRWTPLVNEAFATMADVRRVLGDLPEGDTRDVADLMPTADGRAKTVDASRARLARLAGRDAAQLSAAQWRAFADFLASAQMRFIEDQIALIASRDALSADAPVVGAGVGRALISRLARARGRAYRAFEDFIDAAPALQRAAADCAPAAALALLER